MNQHAMHRDITRIEPTTPVIPFAPVHPTKLASAAADAVLALHNEHESAKQRADYWENECKIAVATLERMTAERAAATARHEAEIQRMNNAWAVLSNRYESRIAELDQKNEVLLVRNTRILDRLDHACQLIDDARLAEADAAAFASPTGAEHIAAVEDAVKHLAAQVVPEVPSAA